MRAQRPNSAGVWAQRPTHFPYNKPVYLDRNSLRDEIGHLYHARLHTLCCLILCHFDFFVLGEEGCNPTAIPLLMNNIQILVAIEVLKLTAAT